MSVTYTYSHSQDFINLQTDIVNSQKLKNEINNSDISGVLQVINVFVTSNDDIDFIFEESLSAGDIVILNDLVENHTGIGFETYDQYEFYVESTNESTTTSVNYIKKLSLVVSNISAGIYRVFWSFVYSQSSSSAEFKSRVQVDDTDTIWEIAARNVGNEAGKNYPASGVKYINLSAGDHFIDIDFASSSSSKISRISLAKIELRRIS